MFPKPLPRPKKKPVGLRRRRWGVQRKARGTAHSRRPRQLGRMAWLHSLRVCFVWDLFRTPWVGDPDWLVSVRLVVVITACQRHFEVMHLFGRYNDGDTKTALGCQEHHQDIDQTRSWFRLLTDDQRVELKLLLVARATAGWMGLPPETRLHWDETAAARRRGPRSFGA